MRVGQLFITMLKNDYIRIFYIVEQALIPRHTAKHAIRQVDLQGQGKATPIARY